MAECLFCNQDNLSQTTLFRTKFSILLFNPEPAVFGHLLAIPARHVCSLCELDEIEFSDLWSIVIGAHKELKRCYCPEGFNYLHNEGKPAGQTIEHAHVHLFPRHIGDNLSNMQRIAPGQPISQREKENLRWIFQTRPRLWIVT